MAEREAVRDQGSVGPVGVHFGLYISEFDKCPLVKGTCSYCKTLQHFPNTKFVWQHCGFVDTCPADVAEQFEARLPKPSIAQKIREAVMGKTESQLNSF
jgi:hypothetical protein